MTLGDALLLFLNIQIALCLWTLAAQGRATKAVPAAPGHQIEPEPVVDEGLAAFRKAYDDRLRAEFAATYEADTAAAYAAHRRAS